MWNNSLLKEGIRTAAKIILIISTVTLMIEVPALTSDGYPFVDVKPYLIASVVGVLIGATMLWVVLMAKIAIAVYLINVVMGLFGRQLPFPCMDMVGAVMSAFMVWYLVYYRDGKKVAEAVARHFDHPKT